MELFHNSNKSEVELKHTIISVCTGHSYGSKISYKIVLSSSIVYHSISRTWCALVGKGNARVIEFCTVTLLVIMGQDASLNRKGANETRSSKDKNFVHLPNTCPWWTEFKGFLTRLQAKEILSIDDYILAFNENDPFKESKELTNLKRACMHGPDAPVDEKLFIEELLPWLAGKALSVEHLFTENGKQGLVKVSIYGCMK